MTTIAQLERDYPTSAQLIFSSQGFCNVVSAIKNYFLIPEDGDYFEDCFGDIYISATMSINYRTEQGGESDELIAVEDHPHISVEVWDEFGEVCREAAQLFEKKLN